MFYSLFLLFVFLCEPFMIELGYLDDGGRVKGDAMINMQRIR